MAVDAEFTPSDGSGMRSIMIFNFAGEFETEYIYRATENTGLIGNHHIFLSKVYQPETISIVVTNAVWPTILTARNLKGSLKIGQGTITNVRLLNAKRTRGLNQSGFSVAGNVRTPTFDYIEMTSTWVKEAT